MQLDFRFVGSPPHQNQTEMSSSLTTLVPVLTGPNYTSWAPMMQSFLMSQGQWKVIMNPPLSGPLYPKLSTSFEGVQLTQLVQLVTAGRLFPCHKGRVDP